ncbi:hypothetical protein GCM10022205_57470 [Spinactinospora alkalitolerans]
MRLDGDNIGRSSLMFGDRVRTGGGCRGARKPPAAQRIRDPELPPRLANAVVRSRSGASSHNKRTGCLSGQTGPL